MAELISATYVGCVAEAVELLSQGELVAYPTDTVYGLGAAATNDDAVRRLYAVKGRPMDKAMPLLIADAGDASWVAEVTPAARTLMGKFWPGPLTIVMKRHPDFRSMALAGGDSVALRVPDQDVVREIIRALRSPLTGTSANRAGARAPVSASEVAFALGDLVPIVIDGGKAPGGDASTIIDITVTPFEVVREGAVSRQELREALGKDLA